MCWKPWSLGVGLCLVPDGAGMALARPHDHGSPDTHSRAHTNACLALAAKSSRKTLLLWAVQFISLQICNGWHLFAFLCGFGKEERIWIQNSYKMAWHGVAWIGLFCLLLLCITFHINFRLWVDVYLALQSCTPLQLILLFEKEIPRVYLLCIRNQSPTWRLGEMGWWRAWAARGKFSLFKGSPWAGEFQVCSQPCSQKFRQTVVPFLHLLPLALLSVLTLQPGCGVTTLHVPRAVFSAVVGHSHGPAWNVHTGPDEVSCRLQLLAEPSIRAFSPPFLLHLISVNLQ